MAPEVQTQAVAQLAQVERGDQPTPWTPAWTLLHRRDTQDKATLQVSTRDSLYVAKFKVLKLKKKHPVVGSTFISAP